VEKDKHYVWHPFTHQFLAKPPIPIVRGEGVYFFDEAGNKYLDAISSWWVNLHGHCNPYISKKVSEQLFTLEHSMFSDFTHAPAIELAERLLSHLPTNQSKIFYSDNGSTAVEVALKMALQYWHNQGVKKTTFIAFENAYHGDTFGSMSVGARNVFNQAFENLLFDVVHIPLPLRENFEDYKKMFSELVQRDTTAAFIFEPLVQGAAGMCMYEAELLDELVAICKNNKVISIADEVMTGFGRTGKFFASDYLSNSPDIFCLSKGLTGGYMPMGVTSCASFIYEVFLSKDKTKTFFHGHSYTANPTACSAALASMDLMEEQNTFDQIAMISDIHKSMMPELQKFKSVKNIRIQGTILAIEVETGDGTYYLHSLSETISSYFLERGILLRPLGNIFYLIPPYVITHEQLSDVYSVIKQFLASIEQEA
jgi:adenosylmethionine-8-amino-7-oxononanoate aminotransferase